MQGEDGKQEIYLEWLVATPYFIYLFIITEQAAQLKTNLAT